MTMKVERAARELINLLLSSLDTEVCLESTAISGRDSPTSTVAIIPKKVDIAELNLKPGTVQYKICVTVEPLIRALGIKDTSA